MPSISQQEINQALEKNNLQLFFSLLDQANSDAEKYQFIEQALELAILRADIKLLQQFANIRLEQSYAKRVYEKALDALIQLGALEVATYIAVYGQRNVLSEDICWAVFARVLLKHKKYSHIPQAYSHIKESKGTEDIIRGYLATIELPSRIKEWLEWFSRLAYTCRYLSIDFYSKLSAESSESSYYSPGYTPSSIEQAAAKIPALIINHKSFSEICKHLQTLKLSEKFSQLLEAVGIQLIKNNLDDKFNQFVEVLPDSLKWLTRLYDCYKNNTNIDVIDNIQSYSERVYFVKVLIKRIYHQEKEATGAVIAAKLIAMSYNAQQNDSLICAEACDFFIKERQIDCVIELLRMADCIHYKNSIIEKLLSLELTSGQYSRILAMVSDLSKLYPYNFSSHSKEYVENEQQRRMDMIPSMNLEDLESITNDDEAYDLLCEMIEDLIQEEEFEEAIIYCKKLTIGEKRDEYLKQIIHDRFKLKYFYEIKNLIQLLSSRQERSILGDLVKAYQQKKYRTVARKISRLDYDWYFGDLLKEAINVVCNEPDRRNACDYLLSIRVFERLSHYCSSDYIEKLSRYMARILLSRCNKPRILNRLINHLVTHHAENLIAYILEGLLENNEVALAVYLLHEFYERKLGSDRLSYSKLLKKFEFGLRLFPPSVELLRQLESLSPISDFSHLIEVLFYDFFKYISLEKINIINAVPVAILRTKYLTMAVVRCVLCEQLYLAQEIILHMPVNTQSPWRTIVRYIEENQIASLFSFQRQHFYNKLLLEWTIKRLLARTQSTNALLQWLKADFKSWHELIERRETEQQKDFNTYSTKYNFYQDTISLIAQDWAKRLLRLSAYAELIEGLDTIMPAFKKGMYNPELHRYLENLLKDLTGLADYNLAARAFVLLVKFDKQLSETIFFKLFNSLLISDLIEPAESILIAIAETHAWPVVQKSYVKICEKYFNANNYPKVFELLDRDRQYRWHADSIRTWIINFINCNNFSIACQFIDKYFMGLSNFITPIIEAFIQQKQLTLAVKYIANISSPSLVWKTRQKLQDVYIQQLADWIGHDRAEYLVQLYRKSLQIPKWISNPDKRDKANIEIHGLIVELFGQLDKAFLEIYREEYAVLPERMPGQPIHLYFPIVPRLKKKTITENLQYYFGRYITSDFAKDLPELYQYIKEIQPLYNHEYQWLGQLRTLANTQKHAENLPMEYNVDEILIDMQQFIPQAIKGVTEILLRLFNPRAGAKEIDEMQVKHYILPSPQSMARKLTAHMLIQSSSTNLSNPVSSVGPTLLAVR